MSDEQLLRDRLHAEVALIDLPPGLAARVTTGARHRRRARLTVAGAAVATVAAVAVAVPLLPAGAPAGSGGSCADRATVGGPEQGPATDISGWAFRGDPAVKPIVARIADGGDGLPEPIVLLAQPLGAGRDGMTPIAYAYARELQGSWWVTLGTAAFAPGSQPVAIAVASEPLRPLPAARPGAQVSAMANGIGRDAGDARDQLVVLTPAGTVGYRPCAGEPAPDVRHSGDGVLVARLPGAGRAELRGTLSISTGGRTVHQGPIDDASPVVRRSGGTLRLPPGYRPGALDSIRLTAPRQRLVRGFAASSDLPARGPVAVLVTCSGTGAVEVGVGPDPRAVPCDGRTREFFRGTFVKRTDTVAVTSVGPVADAWVDVMVAPAR